MKLIEIENEIKAMIAEDVNNPKIYDKIYRLVYLYLKRKHLLSYEQDYVEVAHIGATDLYLKAYKGNPVYSWLGYISLAYRAYIRQYRKLYRSEIIDTTGNDELQEAIINMSSASMRQEERDYEKTLNQIYISNINSTIIEILEYSKYFEYTSRYYNAMLTIIISIIKGRYTPYHQLEGDIAYTHILYIEATDAIISNIGISNKQSSDDISELLATTFENMPE